MGGTASLLMPVTPQATASWASHTRRSPRSTEPGTDMFVPIGTPVLAPGDGVIYGAGNTIGPATGRWNGIDLDVGLRWRGMHYSRLVRTSGRVKRGDVIAYSGASGYGHEDWSRLSGMPGAHVHVTLWPTHATRFGYDSSGRPYTVDFMNYVGGSSGGGGQGEWDEMATKAEVQQAVADALADTRYGVGSRSLFDLGNDARGFAERAALAAESVGSVAAVIRADLNYIHVVSPYSLKAILEAQRNGSVTLTDAQAAAIGGQLSAAAVAGIDAALKDDFDGVKARLAQLPAETIAALKSAL